ncbi:hypothetical protein BH23GEM9_BH23GEM9_08400 [soil metagenome]
MRASPIALRACPIAPRASHVALAVAVASFTACSARDGGTSPASDADEVADALDAGVDTGAATATRTVVDLQRHFDVFAAEGAFVLYDAAADRFMVHGPERAARGFLPASTFKILNSLIALEVGAVRDEHEVIPWDGVDRGDWWNGDQALTRAFQRSSVWVYQELARRIGEARMREWVNRAGYGNADIGGGLDRFWLEGALRISPEEQVDVLRRLHAGTLPFSERSQSIVRRLMLFDEGSDHVIRAKTGWARPGGLQLGWLVGWVERGEDTYFFATHIESRNPDIPMQRAQREITRGALRELGVLPQSPGDDPGRGVIGFTGPGPDTVRVRAQPAISAPVVAELRRPVDGPYEMLPREIRPNLIEYDYEIDGIPFDSIAGSWARVIHGYRLDESPVLGWVALNDGRVHAIWWPDLLLRSHVWVRDAVAAALFTAPAGHRLDLPDAGAHFTVWDYDLVPIRADGQWLHVRVRAPSACGGEPAVVDTTAWIRYVDANGRPLVAARTRGC